MIKRLVDIFGSLFGLVLLSPVIIVTAILVRAKLGSPILFRQVRPGKNAEPFEMLKFRTMLDATGADGAPLPDEERLTPFGKKLRAFSLDELPELWNVLKGDMSLVGPRPLLMEYVPLYDDFQWRRHEAKPGITGWAQVNGRNALSWKDKFALDVHYVDHQGFWFDMKIIFMTLKKLVLRDGINAPGDATMPRFTGDE